MRIARVREIDAEQWIPRRWQYISTEDGEDGRDGEDGEDGVGGDSEMFFFLKFFCFVLVL